MQKDKLMQKGFNTFFRLFTLLFKSIEQTIATLFFFFHFTFFIQFFFSNHQLTFYSRAL
jgi:hypothetical protein